MVVKSLPRTKNGASQQALNQRWQQLRAKSIKKYQAKKRIKNKTQQTPSTLTKKLQPIYNILRPLYMQHNRTCIARYPGCTIQATEIHHRFTRTGFWLIMTNFYLPVCRSCHRRATKNSREAIDTGVSISRLSNPAYSFTQIELELMRKFNINPPT